jgi:hypothetical protein
MRCTSAYRDLRLHGVGGVHNIREAAALEEPPADDFVNRVVRGATICAAAQRKGELQESLLAMHRASTNGMNTPAMVIKPMCAQRTP